jgi:hypothetical protein
MALLVTSVFGVTGCGSDDGEAPVESRIKNSGSTGSSRIRSPEELGASDKGKIKYLVEDIKDLMSYVDSLVPDQESSWTHDVPLGPDLLQEKSLLDAGHHVGVDTAGCSLRNANRGLRSEPPDPQVQVSPWLQSTICPDLLQEKSLLDAGHHVGVDTAGCNLRNAHLGLRSEPPDPQVQVSPWLQSTICPDPFRRPLE